MTVHFFALVADRNATSIRQIPVSSDLQQSLTELFNEQKRTFLEVISSRSNLIPDIS